MTHAQVFPLPGPHWVHNGPESEPIYDHEQPAWLGVARWLSGAAVRRGASSRVRAVSVCAAWWCGGGGRGTGPSGLLDLEWPSSHRRRCPSMW